MRGSGKRTPQMLTDYLQKCAGRPGHRMKRGRRSEIVAYYVAGHSLRECAKQFGVSFQRVHQIVQAESPDAMHAPYDRWTPGWRVK
jgi:uncharacterized protein (DUF433 family)